MQQTAVTLSSWPIIPVRPLPEPLALTALTAAKAETGKTEVAGKAKTVARDQMATLEMSRKLDLARAEPVVVAAEGAVAAVGLRPLAWLPVTAALVGLAV